MQEQTIIQFPHPGGEHSLKTGIEWNTGGHFRKYLKVKGTYLEDLVSHPINEVIYFWGEWEAQSEAIKTNNKPPLPTLIFEPFYKLIPLNGTNTDPFIFGEQFYFSLCKQGHYPCLRELNKGDIILFGSGKQNKFVLDTVFVIKDWEEYTNDNHEIFNNNTFPKTLRDVTLSRIYSKGVSYPKEIEKDPNCGICLPKSCDNEEDNKPTDGNKKYRIYRAAMFEDRDKFNGIFSYSPCLPHPVGLDGFKRPIILHNSISDNLTQGLKIIKSQNAVKFWKEIANKVLNTRCKLMIKNEMPKHL
jgi:hypothetical protein